MTDKPETAEQYAMRAMGDAARQRDAEDQADGYAAEAREWRNTARMYEAERDVARAQVVGLERTLAAREAHLAMLEALVAPKRLVLPDLPEGDDWRNHLTAVPEPVMTWREGLTPTSPDLADAEQWDTTTPSGLVAQHVRRALNAAGIDALASTPDWSLRDRFMDTEAAQALVELVASSTPVEEPGDNGSGDQAERVWTTRNPDKIPPTLLQVQDSDGDTWRRNTPESPWEYDTMVRTTEDMVRTYGPVIWKDQT